jgi:hypothetical protein
MTPKRKQSSERASKRPALGSASSEDVHPEVLMVAGAQPVIFCTLSPSLDLDALAVDEECNEEFEDPDDVDAKSRRYSTSDGWANQMHASLV